MSNKINWFERVSVGQKFGRLTILELPEKLTSWTKISCRCDCGNDAQVILKRLLSGNTKSCGCLAKEVSSRNGKAAIKKYQKAAVKSRIANSTFDGDRGNEYYKVADYFHGMHRRANGNHYKSLGRLVCDEWSWSKTGYQNFKSWLLSELYRLKVSLDEFNSMCHYELTVDRIDNNSIYSPDNCRLATRKQQNRNKSNSLKYLGKHIRDYADELGFSYKEAYEYYIKNEFGNLLLQYGGLQ